MAAYVISQWQVSNTPDSEGNLVNIRGRQPGILNWILSLLGVEPKVHLKVDNKHVRFEQGSIGGSTTHVIQLSAVTSTLYGFTKPWKQTAAILVGSLYFAYIMLFKQPAGVSAAITDGMTKWGLIVGISGLIVAGLYYFLKQEMSVGLIDESGHTSVIAFKRSVIEGQKLGQEQAAYASSIIQWACDNSRRSSHG
jgi:hypothetical protein